MMTQMWNMPRFFLFFPPNTHLKTSVFVGLYCKTHLLLLKLTDDNLLAWEHMAEKPSLALENQ